jgi:hypothetical protein
VHEVASGRPSTQRRRSERVSKSLTVVVRGADLLGQPFEERTSTVSVNLHGCRYASRHHLSKNSWVTLELPRGDEFHSLRARVASVQRPQAIRDLFQIAVELESPANIWGIDSPPADWIAPGVQSGSAETRAYENSLHGTSEAGGAFDSAGNFMKGTPGAMTTSGSAPAPENPSESSSPIPESPLVREWKMEFEQQLNRAVESASGQAIAQLRQKIDEFERAQADAREDLSVQLSARQEEFLLGIRSEFERGLQGAHDLLDQVGRTTEELRAQNDAARESASRIAEERLQIEAAEAGRASKAPEASRETQVEEATADWREAMKAEMQIAQSQWGELLQSSLDSGVERLVKQLSGLSQDVLRSAEHGIAERVAELRQPLMQISSGIKDDLDEQIVHARSSLLEIEQAAGRIKDYASQLDTTSHETLNELHRRLENMLDAQTEELKRRGDELVAGLRGRLAPTIDSLSQQLVDRTLGDIDAKITARVERIPELLRELSAREAEVEESLRLHRERLRQIAENSQREIAARVAATEAALRGDFENARKDALAKWSEELDAAGIRASHAAAESIGRSSEWFQQEARARTQVLIEQAIANAGSTFSEKAAEAAQAFAARLEEQSSARVDGIKQKIDQTVEQAAGDVALRARTKLDEAAEAAAASFGQVLRRVSDVEIEQFANRSRGVAQERERELENFTQDLLQKIGSNAGATLENFHAQLESRLDATVTDAKKALHDENAAALESYRAGRDAGQEEWVENLDRAAKEAAGKFQEGLNNAGDSWLASSSRRLHEHGQGLIESLSRSTDQALRASCSKLFEELSRILRDTVTDGGAAGFAPESGRESPGPPAPPQ